MAAAADKDEALKRLGGGRWQTRDERFSIEPQSGTWVIVDAEQTDDLGLPLVRGPFASLGAAKAAIAAARATPPVASPLADRAALIRGRTTATAPTRKGPAAESPGTTEAAEATGSGPKRAAPAKAGKAGPKRAARGKAVPSHEPVEPPEPRWIADLDIVKRRRARRLLERLTDADAPDAEGIVRRDVVGQVPAAAAFAVVRQIQALGTDASAASIARLLVDGGDDDLGVRWRLVDGDGRPITLEPDAIERGRTR